MNKFIRTIYSFDFNRQMIKSKKIIHCIFSFCLLFSCSAIFAASGSCSLKDVPPEKVRMGVQASLTLENWLNNTDAEVAIIARQGQQLLKYGITFSHAAFAVKNTETNRWTVHHQLNECPKNSSRLYSEGIGMFFMNNPKVYQAAIVIPDQEIQQSLKALLTNPNSINNLYYDKYSAIAYPFSEKRQNSNSWILEIFAKAVSKDNIQDRKSAQQWLENNEYTPSIIRTSTSKRVLGHLFIGNISLNGHPKEVLKKGELWVNSGDSTLKFIAKYGQSTQNCDEKILGEKVCIVDVLP